jgi:hypothetical protein
MRHLHSKTMPRETLKRRGRTSSGYDGLLKRCIAENKLAWAEWLDKSSSKDPMVYTTEATLAEVRTLKKVTPDAIQITSADWLILHEGCPLTPPR